MFLKCVSVIFAPTVILQLRIAFSVLERHATHVAFIAVLALAYQFLRQYIGLFHPVVRHP
jgi:hypothetical protein